VFVVVQDAANDSTLATKQVIPVLPTAKLYQLCTLTKRELEILHFVAKGMYTHEIGDRICRAEKTVEHHINAIHSKLGTNNRAELVRFASERGIQSFTDQEWDSIVTGAQSVQKETA
jgi:DNA-binding NarL/FixJ family response regulator